MKRDEAASASRAQELSAMFALAGWTPSTENFSERPFVVAHPGWFTVAGSPPGMSSRAKSCRTEQEVIDFLNQEAQASTEIKPPELVSAEPAPEPAREPRIEIREVIIPTPSDKARIAELEAALAEATKPQAPPPGVRGVEGEGDASSENDNLGKRDDPVTSESFRELKDEVAQLVRDRMDGPDQDERAKDEEIERLQAELEALQKTLAEEQGIMRDIDIRGVTYKFSSKDALTLLGAFIVNLARDPAQIKLESGETVEVTIDDVEHIGRQLAGQVNP